MSDLKSLGLRPGPAIPSVGEKEVALTLDSIRIDGGTQTRVIIEPSVVEEYAAAMKARDSFPRIMVYREGKTYWLADGFHRFYAAKSAGLKTIEAIVRPGTKRDALLYSLGANAKHGLRRTNADKHHVVRILLEDEEWGKWSDREIALRCHVNHELVGRLRSELSGVSARCEPQKQAYNRTVQRNGKTYEMNASGIAEATHERKRPAAEQGSDKAVVQPRLVPHEDAVPDEDEQFEAEVRAQTPAKRKEFHQACPNCDCDLIAYEKIPTFVTWVPREARSGR